MTAQTTTPTLTATNREVTGKQVNRLRREGLVPAVVYGNDKAAESLSLNAHDFEKLFKEVGTTTLLNLKVGDKGPVKVLIHEVQHDPTKHGILHVDLFRVNMKEKLRTAVPLVFTGTSAAVEDLDGTLVTVKDSVEVECLPEDLIQEINVDIAKLATFDDTLHVSDLPQFPGVTILDDAEETIASIAAPRSEEEMAELEEPVGEEAVPTETEEGAAAEGEEEAAKEE